MMPNVKNKKILDLGCGYGENDNYYKELGAKSVLGVDISTHMIEMANRYYVIREEYEKESKKEYRVQELTKIDKKKSLKIR